LKTTLCGNETTAMLADLAYEWRVYRVLRKLARQRVGLVLQPGNVWVIEFAVRDDEQTDALLKTCYMRGWVEPLENSVPKGKLAADGSLPTGNVFQSSGPVWKLTDSGWSAINRTHQLAILSLFLSLLGVLLAVAA
jgi:hypothetical protein